MNFDTFAVGLNFAEGPVILPDDTLLCVEVLGGNLTSIDRNGKTSIIVFLDGGPNGAAIGPDGRCYVCNNGGLSPEDIENLSNQSLAQIDHDVAEGRIEAVDLKTGEFIRLYDHCEGKPLIAPNDLVFDQHGGFYFSDYGSLRQATPQPGYVYYARFDGTDIQRLDFVFERPNGVGLSPDGSTLYVSETSTGRLWALDIFAPGKINTGTMAKPIYHDPDLSMDSLAVQADGKICVACPHNNLIVRVSLNGNAEHIPTPPGGPANICFGGSDYRTAYVACLQAGCILITQWDTAGLPLNY